MLTICSVIADVSGSYGKSRVTPTRQTLDYTVVWKVFVRIYFVVKYFQVNNFMVYPYPRKYFSDKIIAI